MLTDSEAEEANVGNAVIERIAQGGARRAQKKEARRERRTSFGGTKRGKLSEDRIRGHRSQACHIPGLREDHRESYWERPIASSG